MKSMKQIPPTLPKQTPHNKLLAEKKRLKHLHRLQKEKLNVDLLFMQKNAGSLLLSGVSTLLSTPKKEAKNKNAGRSLSITSKNQASSVGIADFLPLGNRLLPAAWEIAQPFILTWGIRRMQKWVGGFFTSKKKK